MGDTIRYEKRPTVIPYEHAAAEADVARHHGEEVTEDVAASIAAAFMSPGSTGEHLAALATTGSAEVEGLLDNIHAAWVDADPSDRKVLDMLATHVLNHPSVKK